MADLEQQLQRYADEVEGLVAPSRVRPALRRGWYAAAAAVLVVVGVVVGLQWGDDESDLRPLDNVTTTVPTTTSLAPTTSEPEPEPEPVFVAVPSVVGLFYDTAEFTLRNVGLVPVPEFRTVPFGDPQVGLVIDQTPGSFSEVEVGSEVVIVVGESEPPPE